MSVTKVKYGLHAHEERFGTEQKCQEYLIHVRWNGRPTCPRCGNEHMNYYLTSRNIYKCSECYKQFSVTQGTIFHRSKIPLKTWFLAIYLFTTKKRGISSIQLGKWLGVKQHTAWFMLHRLREALKEENDIVLGGIVEADETFVGPEIDRDTRLQRLRKMHYEKQNEIHGYERTKRLKMGEKKKRGRKKGSTKEVLQQKAIERGGKPYNSHESKREPFERTTAIFGMMERGGRIVMKKLGHSRKCLSKELIYPHLRIHISKDSILITDESSIYFETDTLFKEHLSVNHDIAYVIDGIHINSIENAWMHFDKMIDGTYFHFSKQHFDRYLDENTYRWNRREESELSIFESFIPLVAGSRITYKKLKERKEQKMAA